MAKDDKWIKGAVENEGALTRQARRAGKTIAEFCDDALGESSDSSETTKRRCRLYRKLKSFNK